jgi:hypothetical protein
MFKGFALGTVRIYGTQEILSGINDGAIAEGVNVSDIILTENYIQLPPETLYDSEIKSSYETLKKNWISFVNVTEGFYFIEFYEGIKYKEVRTEGWHNSDFLMSENYVTWETNVYEKNNFLSEYTAYLNLPERKQEKHLRELNKLEKILAKQKERIMSTR